MKWMSSHGYSTFFAFGSGTAAGLTTRTYIAASVFGALLTVSTNGTNVRCSCDFMKKGSSVIVMSLGAGWPAITPSTSLTTCSISACSCLLRFFSSFFVGACWQPAANVAETTSATTMAIARRITIINPLKTQLRSDFGFRPSAQILTDHRGLAARKSNTLKRCYSRGLARKNGYIR